MPCADPRPHRSKSSVSGLGPLRLRFLLRRPRLHAGTLEMKEATLDSASGKFHLSGTASLKGDLDLKLGKTPTGAATLAYMITGTLAEPRVSRSSGPETQARLKADPAK